MYGGQDMLISFVVRNYESLTWVRDERWFCLFSELTKILVNFLLYNVIGTVDEFQNLITRNFIGDS